MVHDYITAHFHMRAKNDAVWISLFFQSDTHKNYLNFSTRIFMKLSGIIRDRFSICGVIFYMMAPFKTGVKSVQLRTMPLHENRNFAMCGYSCFTRSIFFFRKRGLTLNNLLEADFLKCFQSLFYLRKTIFQMIYSYRNCSSSDNAN